MVYLDATTQAAGATKIVVGSHQNGLILHPPTADDRTDASRGADNVRLGGSISTDVAEQQGPIIEPAMAVGDAVVLSPFVVHSVRSPRFRCALEHAAVPTASPTSSLLYGCLDPVSPQVGDNHSRTTKVALAFAYKAASAVDCEPGGNWRAFAELPVARDGEPTMTFHF